MAEVEFNTEAQEWTTVINKRYGASTGKEFKEALEDLFESKDEVLADLEVDDWDESALMDTLHSDKSSYSDPEMCRIFFKILKLIVLGQYDAVVGDVVLLPEDIMWDCDEKDIEEAQKYMNKQCPGGGFSTAAENKNLFKTIAVGRKNQLELLTLIVDIYELAHIQEIVDPKRDFKHHEAWANKCRFFRDYDKGNGDVLRRAIPEFTKRISGGGPHEMVMNPIEDDINIYIQYVLVMNNVIKNMLDSKQENLCPFQVDFIVLGRKHTDSIGDDDKKDDADDDDDDDDEDIMAHLAASCYDSGVVPLTNQLPDGGISSILEKKKIEFIKENISLGDTARCTRTLQDKIKEKIGDNNGQRVIVCIDRSEGGDDDSLYVYKFDDDGINKDYNDMHLSWKTKTALLPNYKSEDNELLGLVGGSLDIGDSGFVFSFHVHSVDRIKCDVWIKAQKLPFLPYHFTDIWPMYFHKDFKTVNEQNSLEHIYKNWNSKTKDTRLMKWIQAVDPEFYKTLEARHLKYQK